MLTHLLPLLLPLCALAAALPYVLLLLNSACCFKKKKPKKSLLVEDTFLIPSDELNRGDINSASYSLNDQSLNDALKDDLHTGGQEGLLAAKNECNNGQAAEGTKSMRMSEEQTATARIHITQKSLVTASAMKDIATKRKGEATPPADNPTQKNRGKSGHSKKKLSEKLAKPSGSAEKSTASQSASTQPHYVSSDQSPSSRTEVDQSPSSTATQSSSSRPEVVVQSRSARALRQLSPTNQQSTTAQTSGSPTDETSDRTLHTDVTCLPSCKGVGCVTENCECKCHKHAPKL